MTKLIVIKIGGQAISQLSAAFFEQIAHWYQQHYQILIVHGGGPMINRLMTQCAVPVHKVNGLRVTDAATLSLTKLALLGDAQPALLAQLTQHQLPVLGLNAADNQLLTGELIDYQQLGYVGRLTSVNRVQLIQLLMQHIGVLAPLALTAMSMRIWQRPSWHSSYMLRS